MNDIEIKLNDLDQRDLKRHLLSLEGPQGPRVRISGREVLNFCSNDYLGLSNHPRLLEAVSNSVNHSGWGAGASRLICGNFLEHEVLEKRMAELKKTKACLVFSCGYMANVGIISSLYGPEDLIVSDKLNHASIIDGILLSRARFQRYAHNDVKDLERKLQHSQKYKNRLIITDSVFSMDGDKARLEELANVAKVFHCRLMVDEAHAFGIFGQQGMGLIEQLNLSDQIDIQMGTFSKAAGSYGAYCCASQEIIDYLKQTARSFIYTTALPPALMAASLEAVNIIVKEDSLRQQLWKNVKMVKEGLSHLRLDTLKTTTPIIPIVLNDAAQTVKVSAELFKRGCLVNAIRPPTVPQGTSRLRLTISAAHTEKDILYLLNALEESLKTACLI